MKDLLSKEHYYYKIHRLFMKSSSYPTFTDNSLISANLPYLQEKLDPPSMIFQKSKPNYK